MESKFNWEPIKTYSDIKFEFFEGIAKITINRPEVYNAFRPETNIEMLEAMDICRERNDINVVVFTYYTIKYDITPITTQWYFFNNMLFPPRPPCVECPEIWNCNVNVMSTL